MGINIDAIIHMHIGHLMALKTVMRKANYGLQSIRQRSNTTCSNSMPMDLCIDQFSNGIEYS